MIIDLTLLSYRPSMRTCAYSCTGKVCSLQTFKPSFINLTILLSTGGGPIPTKYEADGVLVVGSYQPNVDVFRNCQL